MDHQNKLLEKLRDYLDMSDMPKQAFDRFKDKLFDPQEGYFSNANKFPEKLPTKLTNVLKNIHDNQQLNVNAFKTKLSDFEKDYFQMGGKTRKHKHKRGKRTRKHKRSN